MTLSKILAAISLTWLGVGCAACTAVETDKDPARVQASPGGTDSAAQTMPTGVDAMGIRSGEVTLTVALPYAGVREGALRLGRTVEVCRPTGPPAQVRLVAAYCQTGESLCTGLAATTPAMASVLLASNPAGVPLTVAERCPVEP
jgi:hypothetical protein